MALKVPEFRKMRGNRQRDCAAARGEQRNGPTSRSPDEGRNGDSRSAKSRKAAAFAGAVGHWRRSQRKRG